ATPIPPRAALPDLTGPRQPPRSGGRHARERTRGGPPGCRRWAQRKRPSRAPPPAEPGRARRSAVRRRGRSGLAGRALLLLLLHARDHGLALGIAQRAVMIGVGGVEAG